MLGLGLGLQYNRGVGGSIIISLFEAAGYTILSKECADALDAALKDPNNVFYKFSVSNALFISGGYTTLSDTCAYNLTKAMNT